MTRRNVRKQRWIFPLFSPDSDDRLSLKFHRFVILYIHMYVVIHEVWALDNTVYRKGPIALTWCQRVHFRQLSIEIYYNGFEHIGAPPELSRLLWQTYCASHDEMQQPEIVTPCWLTILNLHYMELKSDYMELKSECRQLFMKVCIQGCLEHKQLVCLFIKWLVDKNIVITRACFPSREKLRSKAETWNPIHIQDAIWIDR